uniref:Uncharacterized protein n=1 Tax=Bracon brevicornis TaxID=1563983 RepID=A0A6V7KPS8_9HYME
MAELQVNEEYFITKLKWVTTKFGRRIVAEMNGEFSVFLPYRVVKYCTDNEPWCNSLMTSAEKRQVKLRYLGGDTNQCEFIPV